MKPVDFHLHRPETVGEALDLLARYGDDAKVLAGGQSLVPLLNFRLARPEHVVDIDRVAGLSGMRAGPTGLTVGAMTRQARVERAADVGVAVPLLAAALPYVGHPPIRARGTIGGSLAHADPAAELPAVAIAAGAVLVAESARGRREIPAAEFVSGSFTTALAPDELLVEVRFPPANGRTGAAFVEVSRRRGDFALVGAAAQLSFDDSARVRDARLALIGVGDTPRRCPDAEAALVGTPADGDAGELAAREATAVLRPPGDLHASGDYRRAVAGVVLTRAVSEARRRALHEQPKGRP